MLRNLKTLVVHECDNIGFLFTFFVARSFVQLKCLKISSCKLLKEIVSLTRECGREESMGNNMFPNLEVLNLKGLEKLARFCTGSYVEFPSLKKLDVDDCPELGAFICENVDTSTSSTQGIIIDKETDERDSKQEKNLDVNRETAVQSFLFDEKVGFPRLESLKINGVLKLETIWHCQQAQDSFSTLKNVKVSKCDALINVITPAVMGRLKSLESSAISFRNLTSLAVMNCERLNYLVTFPVAKSLTQLTKLKVEKCKRILVIVASNVGDDDEAENEIAFSGLQNLDFSDLPSLQGFCSSRNCAVKFPSSVTLRTNQVPGLKQFSPMHGMGSS